MCDFRKCTMFLQKWLLNLQDLPRSQSLEKVPVFVVLQYFPHDNLVRIHMCDECLKKNQAFVTSFGPLSNRSCKLIH